MFCPDCGSKLEDPNQNFCPNCGTKVPRIQESPRPESTYQQPTYQPPAPNYSYQRPSTTSYQKPPPTNYQSPPSTTYRSPYPQPRVKPVRDPERFSKISLGMAIPGAIFALIGLYVGFVTFLIANTLAMYGSVPPGVMVGWIGKLVVHSIGLAFGIIAVAMSKKAQRLETENGIQKAGAIIGLLALAFNILLMLLGIFQMITIPVGSPPLYP